METNGRTGNSNNMVIGIYFHPEAYPPTLNAVGELSKCFSHISIVHRPHLKSAWNYPANVSLVATGKHMEMEQQKNASFFGKTFFFFQFVAIFLKICLKEKPAYIL